NGIKKLVDEIYKHDMDEFSPEALIAVISHYQLMRNNEKAVTYGSDVVQDVFVRFFNDYFPKMKFEDFITSEEKRLEAIGRIGSEILKSQADYTF
ncbi:hypothetical protein HOC35_05090, partial [Candidatus Woesearchaeota archaeon]|nr:hypothetical protein [Candidatus Woesearchaeota archaeon]